MVIYYKLGDLLSDATEYKKDFTTLNSDITIAVKHRRKKYEKYYIFMDDSDTYYITAILDPRIKTQLITKKIINGGKLIIQTIRNQLHKQYPLLEDLDPPASQTSQHQSFEFKILQKL